jgi:hypothetical protein
MPLPLRSPLAAAPVQAAVSHPGEAPSSKTTASRGGLAFFKTYF